MSVSAESRLGPCVFGVDGGGTSKLTLLVTSVYRRIQDRIRNRFLVLRGGLIENNSWLRDRVAALLAERHRDIRITGPAEGAAYRACMLAAGLVRAQGAPSR
jgi:hypothetical protein